jgi:hypothetical protein
MRTIVFSHDAIIAPFFDKKILTKTDLLKLESVLRTVVNDHHLQDTVKALREKMVIFDRLRQIMHLTKKSGT